MIDKNSENVPNKIHFIIIFFRHQCVNYTLQSKKQKDFYLIKRIHSKYRNTNKYMPNNDKSSLLH